MPQADLSKSSKVDTSVDSIVIMNLIEDVPGGKTLDVTGVASSEEVIKAGHVIIEEDATGIHKPQAISGGSYTALPSGHTYKGVLVASIKKSKPFASIMVRGTVNEVAATSVQGLPAYLSAAKDALGPLIRFTKD